MSPEGSPILETAATQDSPIGTYPILVSQGTLDPTYTYIFEDGTLTITDNTEPTIPIILTHPSDSTVPVGESLFFSTFATGSEPLFYQWLKNGEPIAGATDSFFTIFEVLPADAGVYQVLVYNEAGQMLSQEAKLTPLPLHLWKQPLTWKAVWVSILSKFLWAPLTLSTITFLRMGA
jgi:hypothetical protein